MGDLIGVLNLEATKAQEAYMEIIALLILFIFTQVLLAFSILKRICKKCKPCPPVYGYGHCGKERPKRKGSPDMPNFYKED